jgi:2-(1,2-epoxy-1,2-dihydrophenyl)acetyl-CoA isomerase
MIYPDLDGQLALEADLQHELARSDDFLEGVGAFVEKREAAFRGS